MPDDHPKNPDLLLAALGRDDARKRRGRHKVFLGMAPGVGKTYAMLEAAHRAQREGRDVVVGYLDTHGRQDTEALASGLSLTPRRTVHYRAITLEEMDTD